MNGLPSLVLYKYTRMQIEGIPRLEHIRQALVDSQLYFPRPSQLNDPRDCRPAIVRSTKAEEIAHRVRRGKELIAGEPPLRRRKIKTRVRSRVANTEGQRAGWSQYVEQRGVYSLSRTSNNARQWEEYANHGSGICIQFNFDHSLGDLDLLPIEVHYVDDIPKIKTLELDKSGSGNEEDIVRRILCTKTARWKEEEEFRLILDIAKNGGQLKRVPERCIEGLVFGWQACADDIRRITNWARSRKHPLELRRAVQTADRVELFAL